MKVGTTVKIVKNGPFLAAACGSASVCRSFLDWFLGGLKGDCPPMVVIAGKEEFGASGYIFCPDGLVVCFEVPGSNYIRSDFTCDGSGMAIALGALGHGASAEESVRIACRYDSISQEPITVLTHD